MQIRPDQIQKENAALSPVKSRARSLGQPTTAQTCISGCTLFDLASSCMLQPSGGIQMREVRPGTRLLNAKGKVVIVTNVYFSKGHIHTSVIFLCSVCCRAHAWVHLLYTFTYNTPPSPAGRQCLTRSQFAAHLPSSHRDHVCCLSMLSCLNCLSHQQSRPQNSVGSAPGQFLGSYVVKGVLTTRF